MTGYRVQPQATLIKELQSVAESLYQSTQPFRVTIRVQATNDGDLPVLAEVNGPNALSLAGGMSAGPDGQRYKAYDIHKAATVVQIAGNLQPIIQNDTAIDPPALPDSVAYGSVRAQILTALERRGKFVGLISVHQDEPRVWSRRDIEATEQATAATQGIIDRAAWFEL